MRLVDYFYDLKIRTKLMLFLFLPVFIIVIISTTVVYSKWQDYLYSSYFTEYGQVSICMFDLMHELQIERGLSASLEGTKGHIFKGMLQEQRKQTDVKLRSFRSIYNEYFDKTGFSGITKNEYLDIEEEFFLLDKELQRLAAARMLVDSNEESSEFFDYITNINHVLLRLIHFLEVFSNDAQLVRQVDALNTLLHLQEIAAQERGLFNKIINSKNIDTENYIHVKQLAAEQEILLKEFYIIASPSHKATMQDKMIQRSVLSVKDFQLANASTVRRNILLDQLQIVVGYGGLIHDFKNYVLRGVQSDINHFKKSYASAMAILEEFRTIPGLNEVDIKYIHDLISTYSNYQLLLDKAIVMKRKGLSISKIDDAVKIDDNLAINAIHHLRKDIFYQQEADWWEVATSRINLIKEVNDILMSDIINRSNEFKYTITQTLYIYILLFTITLAAILFLSRLLMNRLTGEIRNISKNMRKMTDEGSFEHLLSTTGDDEIGEMACAFNNLIIERKQIDEALLFTQFAVDHAGEAMYWVGSDSNIIYVNNITCNILGYTKKELENMYINNIDPDYSELRWKLIWTEIKQKETLTLQTTHRRKYGTVFPVEITYSYLKYKGQEYCYAFVRDISERMDAENELLASNVKLQNLSSKLQAIREEERTIISREIHDELGQALTGLRMDIEWILDEMPDIDRNNKRVQQTLTLIDNTIDNVRRISHYLRPAILDDFGLVPTIEEHMREFKERTFYEYDLIFEIDDLELKKDRDTAVFRILQEILTNIIRHAHANYVKVVLRQKRDTLFLIVEDNGIGISEEDISNNNSIGLIGMRERAYAVGGDIYFQRGEHGIGTSVNLIVPINFDRSK